MIQTDVERLKARLAAARADVEGKPSAHELEIAAEEIEALWDELGRHADRLAIERERNATFFERAPFACLITDVHGTVREANLAASTLLQVPASYLTGKPLAIFIDDAERETFRMRLALAARALKTPIEGWASRIKSSTGTPRAVKIELRPLPPERGKSVPLLWFFNDID
jgi:two-component system, cell cycle sensor histidine kinase and response regulator CckA